MTLIPSVYLECFEQIVLPQLHVSVQVRALISVNDAHNSRMWTNLSHAATCQTVSFFVSFFLYTMACVFFYVSSHTAVSFWLIALSMKQEVERAVVTNFYHYER